MVTGTKCFFKKRHLAVRKETGTKGMEHILMIFFCRGLTEQMFSHYIEAGKDRRKAIFIGTREPDMQITGK